MASVLPFPLNKIPPVLSATENQHTSLLALVRKHGFTGRTREGEPADLTALAVIIAESGGQADVVNGTPCSQHGDHAVGLMQICSPMHAPVADMKDPDKNVAMGHKIYVDAGNSFARDWTTYRPGMWRGAKDKTITTKGGSILSDATDALVGATGLDKALGPIDEIASALLAPHNWFRVGKGALGGLIVVIGVGGLAVIALKPLAKAAEKVPKL
jgi:Lysozyme like domain